MTKTRDEQLEAAVRSLNRDLLNGFNAITQCLDSNLLEHGIVQAVRVSLETHTSVLWRLTVLKDLASNS